MWKANGRTDAYPWQKLTWPKARWAKKWEQVSSPPCSIIYYLFFFFFRTHLAPVSTPSILLTRVHVTWHVHKWSFINICAICVICYVLKRISSSILQFSSLIIFIRSVIFFILIFVENLVKTLLVVEIRTK